MSRKGDADVDNTPHPAGSSNNSQNAIATQNRRRRGVGIVTPNACTECRKKRAKCDGNTPCRRCHTNETDCIYEIPVRHSKETMRGEIEQLQTHRRQAEMVLGALASTHKVDETVNRLRNGQSLEAVSDWLEQEAMKSMDAKESITQYASKSYRESISSTLKMAESVSSGFEHNSFPSWNSNSDNGTHHGGMSREQDEDTMNWIPEAPELSMSCGFSDPLQLDDLSPDTQAARGRGQVRILGPTYKTEQHADFSLWTTVTSDTGLVEHLMALYFCWEYPTFASLSKEHFLTDFRSGNPRFCSSLLVNAMLALGCRFSTLPETRTDPNDPDTSGDHFFAEAQRLLLEDDHTNLTTIQALGLMSIRQCSCGRDTESLYLAGQAIRLCIEYGLHIEATDAKTSAFGMEYEVKSATFWGAFALDQAWSLSIGRIPHVSRTARLVLKPDIVPEIESSEWVPYSDAGTSQIKNATQPSNVRSVFRCFAELSELVHQSLYTLHTPGHTLTSSEVVSMYFRYLNWYSSLPEVLRLGHNFTPAVLFAHMYYHFAILMILRPFVKLRFLGSGVSPRNVCAQAADAITTLIRSYDNLYTLNRTPSFVPYIALSSSIIHLVVGTTNHISGNPHRPQDASVGGPAAHTSQGKQQDPFTQILQAAQDLKSMCSCHGFSHRALDVMRFLALQWEISSDGAPQHSLSSPDSHSTYVFHKLNLALGSPTDDDKLPGRRSDAVESKPPLGAVELRRRCRMSSASLNYFCPDMGETLPDTGPLSSMALFNPFPMQGLPLLLGESDEELLLGGFERLEGKSQ